LAFTELKFSNSMIEAWWRSLKHLCLADIASGQTLTLAWYVAMILAMRHVVATVTAIRFALSARRGVLLELLARHHQVAVCLRETQNVLRPLNLSAASASELGD
jgi:hypothetical protein